MLRLLPVAPLVPITTVVATNTPLLARLTLSLAAAPLPITKPAALLHTELFPVTNTCWLLQPLPTM